MTRLAMSTFIFRVLDRLFVRVEVDYVEAADQLLGFRERPVDPQMLAAAILHGDRLAIAAKPDRNAYQPALSASHARAEKLVEFLLMEPDATVQFVRVKALRFSAHLPAGDHVLHRDSPWQLATCSSS